MKRFLIPLSLLLLGTGGGVGAGLLLAPPATAPSLADGEHADEGPDPHAEADAGRSTDPLSAGIEGHDYVRLNNQFVVPLLTEGEVASLVLLSIAVEVSAGKEEDVLLIEPKLRDLFLQVLFDHANAGGFDGLFTSGSTMRELRRALLSVAQEEIGPLVTDVLILDLARQAQ